jgi:hypothetical protein
VLLADDHPAVFALTATVLSGGSLIKTRETAIMNKSLLSQVLDGAAFPAIMLAVAVSPINVGPHQRDTLHEGKRLVTRCTNFGSSGQRPL